MEYRKKEKLIFYFGGKSSFRKDSRRRPTADHELWSESLLLGSRIENGNSAELEN